MRIPDWLFRPLDRLVTSQTRLRREESARRAAQEDAVLRQWADNMRAKHSVGTCGGAEAGCRFVPCIPRVS